MLTYLDLDIENTNFKVLMKGRKMYENHLILNNYIKEKVYKKNCGSYNKSFFSRNLLKCIFSHYVHN